MHSFAPQITGFDRLVHCVSGRTAAGNTPTMRARVGQSVAIHVIGSDSNFHTFHIHGHRWRDSGGAFVDCPTVGPNETITAAFTEDNLGRWLYHCHVFTHRDAGMAGWYLVTHRRRERMPITRTTTGLLALALDLFVCTFHTEMSQTITVKR